jgi:hypothetical protein
MSLWAPQSLPGHRNRGRIFSIANVFASAAALLALAGHVPEVSAAPGEQRHALVVGNAAYKAVTPLDNPINDSREICASLKKLGFQATCASDVKTKGQFKDLIAKFTQSVKKGDVILFFYAGHGVEMDGENYLVPTTAEFKTKGGFEDDAIKVNFILGELEATGSRLSVVILDACRDNPFGTKARSAVGRGLAVPDKAPAGSIIIFPTSPGKVALDGGNDARNGMFTKHLLRHISTNGLEVENMFKRVIEGVKSESEQMGHAQIPWMNLSFTGEFCFAGCVDRAADAREKEQLALRAKELELQLSQQQKVSEEFRERMKGMEVRLASQQQTVARDTPEFMRLEAERSELAKKVALLESQDKGLKKAQTSLHVFQQSRSEIQKLEQELAARQKRLQELEGMLGATRTVNGSPAVETAALRKERDDLRKIIQKLLADKKKLEGADKELSDVARIAKESEQYQQELGAYRDRLAALEKDSLAKDKQIESERRRREETEARLKDAGTDTVKRAAGVTPSF